MGTGKLKVIWAQVQIYFGIVQSTVYFLLYIQLFKENATFKLQFVLFVLPCKQQHVTYIRFFKLYALVSKENVVM